MQKLFLLAFGFLLMAMTAGAQRIKKISGNPAPLASEKQVNIIFKYDHVRVGKYEDEKDYVADKKAEYNKKESGKGDKWESSWIGDRVGRYEPNFIEMFEKYTPFSVGNYSSAKYTMIVSTTRIEPGYNIYISRKNAEIDLEVEIIETATQTSVAKYTIKSAPGRTFGGNDYDTGLRIEEAFATAGKHFGKELKGDLK
ncbi:MAG: hypothetical protein JNJ58_08495 [Chitinophagaceae bacterium]|nr:hypothetical protein [Chitinophagaceae bacterium]